MAGLKICGELGCMEVVFEELYRHSRSIRWGGVSLRVAPLEWQLVANLTISQEEGRGTEDPGGPQGRKRGYKIANVLSRTSPSLKKRVSGSSTRIRSDAPTLELLLMWMVRF